MTARALLVRGLVAGLLAGFATFLVAHQVGEPPVETAIALEEAGSHHADGHTHGEDAEQAPVSRGTQRTWGLLTSSLAVGTALGGLVALGAAAVAGRVGRLSVTGSAAGVALVGFVAVALVPFLKYPANPPGVGSGDTIGARTEHYFGFLLVSVVAAVVATVLAARAWPRLGTWGALLLGTGLYLVVVVGAGVVMPTVNEVGHFPADTLWSFRRASLLTLVTLWATIGVALSGLLGRLEKHESAVARRRALAASL
jgi:hypothetical protein